MKTYMLHSEILNERKTLAGRIHPLQIRDYCLHMKHDVTLSDEIFRLLDDEDKRVADNAAWIFTHLDKDVCLRLSPRFNELADKAVQTDDETLRRLLLTVLYRLPFPEQPYLGLLDFCLKEMMSRRQPYGVRCLCMKIAYEICLTVPELLKEIEVSMDIMEPDLLPPSLRCARKNILAALKKRKSLRNI